MFKEMAVIRFNGMIASISGSIGKDSKTYFRTQNGKTYLCKKPKRSAVRSISKTEEDNRACFKQAQKMVKEIYQLPALLAHYSAGYARQKKYRTLRGYIFAQCYQLIRQE